MIGNEGSLKTHEIMREIMLFSVNGFYVMGRPIPRPDLHPKHKSYYRSAQKYFEEYIGNSDSMHFSVNESELDDNFSFCLKHEEILGYRNGSFFSYERRIPKSNMIRHDVEVYNAFITWVREMT